MVKEPEVTDYYGDHWLQVMRAQSGVTESSEREVGEAVALSGCGPGDRILDSACGFGRHLGWLVREGYDVVGSDLSMTLARRASSVEGATVIQADYRTLPFADSSFSAVFNLFTSFGFYGHRRDTAVLGEFRRVLVPGGTLVMQVQHRERLLSTFRPVEKHLLAPGVTVEVRREFDEATNIQRVIETINDSSGIHPSAEISLTVYSSDELCEMAEEAGFATVKLLGGLDGRGFDSQERAVIKATR